MRKIFLNDPSSYEFIAAHVKIILKIKYGEQQIKDLTIILLMNHLGRLVGRISLRPFLAPI